MSTPGDIHEREADRVADMIMGHKDAGEKGIQDEDEPLKSPAAKCACGTRQKPPEDMPELMRSGGAGAATSTLDPQVGTRIQAMRGSGRTLTPGERGFMEPRFGADFSSIRIHSGHEADTQSRALSARAFTVGSDIFFRSGEYTQGQPNSQRLLAHELTHTIQQGAARSRGGPQVSSSNTAVQRDLAIEPPNPTAGPPGLTEGQIAAAIEFNKDHYNDAKSLEDVRDVVGVSPTPAVSDRDLALAVAWWQATFNLAVDGKAGDHTLGTIVRELKAENLRPDALKLLLDLHGTAPPGRAALRFLPVIFDQAPAGWGVTVEDDATFDISVFARPGVWKCVITKADQQVRQGVRLLPGVVEVTPALVAAEASCPRLATMITSLDDVADQNADSGFYMLSAVQAHEDLHITQYRTALRPAYPILKTAVEALTVPLASHNTAASAKAAIKALPAFTAAIATFLAADVAANNATAAHAPMAPFRVIEHGVVDPMITTIRARRTALGCPP